MTISHATDLWLGELERHGHTARTLDTYQRLLDKLADSYPRIDVDELTSTQIRRFLDDQAQKRSGGGRKAPATIAQNVTIINGFLDWLTREQVVTRNPTRRNGDRILARPRQQAPHENDNVTTVSSGDVAKLLAASMRLNPDGEPDWAERLAIHCLAYLGPRRHALAMARISDYDPVERTLTFREKGGKTIAKPVPDRLAALIDGAIAAGVYASLLEQSEPLFKFEAQNLNKDAYLIPSAAEQRRPGERDDRIIWRIVGRVAARAGVTTHVHALRAAFAVRFLEDKPGEVVALQELMGHRRIETTLVYLRRLDRPEAMETVRDLDWGEDGAGEIRTLEPGFPGHSLSRRAPSATRAPLQKEPVCDELSEGLPQPVTVGHEPSIEDLADVLRAGLESARFAPRKHA